MNMDTSEVLDLSKENIQPLRHGRKAAHLKTALQAQTDPHVQQMLQKTREEYEYKIRTYEGDDPLEPYFNYVIWLEQSFPKMNRESNLAALLEDTLLKFKDNEKYKQDPRLVQLTVKYIGMQPNPLELYQLVYDQGLGTMCSLLYKAWAEEFDKLNDIKKADRIYNIGINCRAQPLSELQNAHVQFQLSIARRMIEGSLKPVASEESSRTVLSSLKGSKVKTTRASKDSAGVLPCPRSASSVGNLAVPNFKVFQEDDQGGPHRSDGKKSDNFPKGSVAERENMMQPGKWNQKHKQSYKMSLIPTTPSFSIHEDPEVARPNMKSDFKPRALKVKREEFNPPVAVFEPQDPTKIPMYPKQLVYVGGRDVQLEEIRAVYYWKKMEKIEKEKASHQSIEENENDVSKHNDEDLPLPRIPSISESSENLYIPNKNLVTASHCFTEPSNEVQVSCRSSQLVPKEANPVPKEFSQFPPPVGRQNHSLSTSMTVNTRNALHIIDEMWKSDSSQTEGDFDHSLPSSTQKQNFVVYSEDENKPTNCRNRVFPVYSDEDVASDTKSRTFPVFCDEDTTVASNPSAFHEKIVSKSNSKAFPVFCDDESPKISANIIPVFCDEKAIIRSKTKPDPFPVFSDRTEKLPEDPFDIFDDNATVEANQAAFDDYCQGLMTCSSKSATGTKYCNPFTVFRDEGSLKEYNDPFDIGTKTSSIVTNTTQQQLSRYPEKEMFLEPCVVPPSASKNVCGVFNEENSIKFINAKITSQDCLNDDEELALPMGSLKVDYKPSSSFNTPLPLIVSVEIDDKPLGPEDKENMPPKNYSTPSERRLLSGILTPATNVPIKGEQSDESDDDEENNTYGKLLDLDGDTCTTKAFTIPLPTSTPFSRQELSKKSLMYNRSFISDENDDPSSSLTGYCQKTPNSNQVNDISKKMNMYSPNLSLILENSKELKGSSSSSSGHTGSTIVRTHWGPSF